MTETPERTHDLHNYEQVDGGDPDSLQKHEPRNIVHATIHPLGDKSLSLMSEIGDGLFVSWTTCDGCKKFFAQCGCPTGPKEPAHITRWRTKRWANSFDARPEINHELLPTVLEALKARGLVVMTEDERDHAETGPDGDAKTYDPETGEKVEPVGITLPDGSGDGSIAGPPTMSEEDRVRLLAKGIGEDASEAAIEERMDLAQELHEATKITVDPATVRAPVSPDEWEWDDDPHDDQGNRITPADDPGF